MIDVKGVQDEARKELIEERTKQAKEKLKGLYRDREKAQLALKNIGRQIDAYLNDIAEMTVYEDAGVDTTE